MYVYRGQCFILHELSGGKVYLYPAQYFLYMDIDEQQMKN